MDTHKSFIVQISLLFFAALSISLTLLYMSLDSPGTIQATGIYFPQTLIFLFLWLGLTYLIHRKSRLCQIKLDESAIYDEETGTYNRNTFEIIYNLSIRDINREGAILSLIMFELDRQHQPESERAMDKLLRHIIDRASVNIRENDIICHWKGAKFIILAKNCESDDAEKIAEKIRKSVLQTPPAQLPSGNNIAGLTVSLGVAQYVNGETPDELLFRVEQALSLAKSRGCNRVEVR